MASVVPQLLPIEVNNETKKIRVLTNIIKMLTNRGLLNPSELDDNIKNILSIKSDDMVYKIDLPSPKSEKNTDKDSDKDKTKNIDPYVIKILNQKITAVNKASGISDFLNKYKNYHKILVVNAINNKPIQHIYSHYAGTEIFLEEELMINIVDHVSVPKHIVLTETEGAEVMKAYNAVKRNMPRILITDPVAKYYNMKVGQICKIIRFSETAGMEPYYRMVTGSLTSKS